MIAIGVEGADQGEEEPSHHHVAPGMSLPHEPSQYLHLHRASSLYLSLLCPYTLFSQCSVFGNEFWSIPEEFH
jgi:hypothetical protein